jgi:hypothetical protein
MERKRSFSTSKGGPYKKKGQNHQKCGGGLSRLGDMGNAASCEAGLAPAPAFLLLFIFKSPSRMAKERTIRLL